MTSTAPTAPKTVALYGNSYPVKDKLAKLGGRPRKDGTGKWYWEIPVAREAEARALLGGTARAAGAGSAAFANFKPTPEQEALRAFIVGETGNLFIRAGAGCGKTTVSLWLLGQIAAQVKVMVAFNSDIKTDIEAKAPAGVDVLTMNALGYRALNRYFDRKIEVDSEHLFTIFKMRVGEAELRARYGYYAAIKRLIDLAKGALAESIEDLGQLAQEFEIDFEGDLSQSSADAADEALVIAKSIMDAQRSQSIVDVIDYNDQMWLPVVQNMPLPKADVLVIDESQDTNPLQLEMLARCVNAGGRVIAVGDPRQAIYKFRGADERAVDKIVERFDMTVLPLMTTFRCGKAIVREAQAIVPDFQAGPDNHEGEVRNCRPRGFFDGVEAGDLVLSRTNAPLAAACLRLIRMGKPAAIVGRNGDLVGSLVKLIKKTKAETVAQLEVALDVWLGKERAKIMRRLPVREAALDAATDKVETILAFADDATYVDEVIERIHNSFVGDKGGTVRIDLSTVHKAKGRERDRVWMFADTFCIARKGADGEWQEPSEEEWNLKYVAITRAKNLLVYVDGMKKLERKR